jgi:ABC-type bacteriocin/lantibiotic exporter with double-glycine peptidase domain
MSLRPMGDAGELRARGLDRAVARRAWQLSRPYRKRLLGFVLLIIATSAVSATPPLLIREIIDTAIPQEDQGLLVWLVVGLLTVGLVVAGVSMVERWLSSSIGEELILDLRTMLYRHVHTMPIAFFTRTQTGSLITRLNNDVIGAQRALTGTLGGIVDNLIGVGVVGDRRGA